MKNRSLVVAAGIAALLIPAATAQAATKQVTIGPAKPLAGVPPVAFDADFYPRKITIAKGDHIRFKWTTGFGDVAFAPKGTDPRASAQIAFSTAKKTAEVGNTVPLEMPRDSIEIQNLVSGPKPYLDSK